ncbi:MAG: replication-relaxation family protein, partial [Deltaproteobacteria bacterium]|nr:replication-relaxation family protein [Deltaproteobacteria bacterium]
MATRAKVYERRQEPPRLKITQRDLQILGMVEAFRFVSGDQIERLLFSQGQKDDNRKTRCPARLRNLFDNGLLGRVQWPFRSITLPMIYILERDGADLLALQRGVERDQIRTISKREKRPVISRSLLFLAHTLAVNDLRIDVMLAVQRKGWEVSDWLNEYELGREYAEIEFQGRRRRQAVQPDAYFAIKAGDNKAHFFLEMDMET